MPNLSIQRLGFDTNYAPNRCTSVSNISIYSTFLPVMRNYSLIPNEQFISSDFLICWPNYLMTNEDGL